jgi:hypothetical protein
MLMRVDGPQLHNVYYAHRTHLFLIFSSSRAMFNQAAVSDLRALQALNVQIPS